MNIDTTLYKLIYIYSPIAAGSADGISTVLYNNGRYQITYAAGDNTNWIRALEKTDSSIQFYNGSTGSIANAAVLVPKYIYGLK